MKRTCLAVMADVVAEGELPRSSVTLVIRDAGPQYALKRPLDGLTVIIDAFGNMWSV